MTHFTNRATPRHFVLAPAGSHGDVLPFLGIGRELLRRGHRVTAAVPAPFVATASALELEVRVSASEAEYRAGLGDPALWASPFSGVRYVFSLVQGYLERQYAFATEMAADPAVRVVAGPLALGVRVAQETHGLPVATVQLAPASIASIDAPPRLPGLPASAMSPRWWRRLVAAGLGRVGDGMFKPLQSFRRELGLAPVRDVMASWINSPTLVLATFPEWFAAPVPDWPAAVCQTGFVLFDGSAGSGDARGRDFGVEAFLKSHARPIVFVCGTAGTHGERFERAAAVACRALGRPGIVVGGKSFESGAGAESSTGVARFGFVPLSLLAPRAAALVHHGGIGTLAQGLAAGVPQLVVPRGFDQFDNAVRLARLGVGSELSSRALAGQAMSRALNALLGDPDTARRAREVAHRMQHDDGIGDACNRLEAEFG